MHPPLTLDIVGEEGQVAVSPPTLTLLARVELLEEQICQLAALQDKQICPPGEQISAGSSEPSTPSSVERRRKPAMEVLGDTVAKGTVLERVANLEHLQASISRERSPNGKSPAKAISSLFSSASSSPDSKPKTSSAENGSGSSDLPNKEASSNGHVTDNGKLPPERQLAASDQAGEGALSQSSGLATKQEQSETAGLNTRTTMTPLSPAQDAEPAVAIDEGTTNSMHESKSPPPPPEEEEEEKLEQGNNHLDSTKERKQSRGKPWKRLQNYIKKKMHSMSSSKPR